jgi:DNA polymerase-4
MAVTIDFADGGRCARQMALRPAAANDRALFETARRALLLAWTRRVRVRRLRLIVDRIVFPPAQLALFGDERRRHEKHERLAGAVDAVRRRFGGEALQTGGALGPPPRGAP